MTIDELSIQLKNLAVTVREGFTGVHYAINNLRNDLRERNDRDLEEHQERIDLERRVGQLERDLRATG